MAGGHECRSLKDDSCVLGSLAEFERDLIRERTVAGLERARAAGRVGGRRPALTGAKLDTALRLYDEREHTVEAIGRVVGCSRATIYRALAERESARIDA